jgi:chromosome transmission fidelity protein 8
MIGHHLLEGKVASLPKPLAVLQRHGQEPHFDDGNDDVDAEMDENLVSAVKPGWDVIAIVKRKIIFSKRPMPIVGSTSTVEK